jgi:hypothetical protein
MLVGSPVITAVGGAVSFVTKTAFEPKFPTLSKISAEIGSKPSISEVTFTFVV